MLESATILAKKSAVVLRVAELPTCKLTEVIDATNATALQAQNATTTAHNTLAGLPLTWHLPAAVARASPARALEILSVPSPWIACPANLAQTSG